MSSKELELKIDIADRHAVKRKIPEAKKILATKREEAEEARREVERWEGLVSNLKAMAGIVSVDEATARSSRPSPVQDAVVAIVEREGRAMRPIEVTKRLKAEGHEVKTNAAVNAALYAAAEAGRLRRPQPRQYAPRKPKPKKRASS